MNSGTMNDQVSICIPTCNRPDLLRLCLASCLEQDYAEIEILIGDDSHAGDDRSMEVARNGSNVRYFRNEPALGQSRNVASLIERAQGDRLVLIHDDDLLLPDCVSNLVAAWKRDTVIAFGKQRYITHDGTPIENTVNADYYRTPDRAGTTAVLDAALLSQVPNNGFMVSTAAARAVCYASPLISVACDTDFVVRLGMRYLGTESTAEFLDTYTTVSRQSLVSISRNKQTQRDDMPRDHMVLYDRVRALAVPDSMQYAQTLFLRRKARGAIFGHLKNGSKRSALAIFFSQYHPWPRRFSMLATAVVRLARRRLPSLEPSFRRLSAQPRVTNDQQRRNDVQDRIDGTTMARQ